MNLKTITTTFFIFLFFHFQLAGKSVFLEKSSFELTAISAIELQEKEDPEIKTHTIGGKINLPYAEARFYHNGEKFNYGFSSSSEKLMKYISSNIKAGTISSSGAISKLNNPLLSASVTPFTATTADVSFITSALAGSSSFSNPLGFFWQSQYKNTHSPLQNAVINLFYQPENQKLAFTSGIKLIPVKKIELSSSTTAGYFPYKENSSSSWFFKDDFYYPAGQHFCVTFQNAISLWNLKFLLTFSEYESPLGQFAPTFRLDLRYKKNGYTFTGEAFYNPQNNVLSSSEKKLNELLQFKSSIQKQFTGGIAFPVFYKLGVSFYNSYDFKNSQNNIKIGTGFQLSSILTSLSLTITSELSDTLDSLSLQIKNSWYFSHITPGITLTGTVSPNKDFSEIKSSEKISLNINFLTNPHFSTASSLSFTQKNGESLKNSFTSSVNLRFSVRKKLNCTGKLSVAIEF